jgi:hypothetical protein
MYPKVFRGRHRLIVRSGLCRMGRSRPDTEKSSQRPRPRPIPSSLGGEHVLGDEQGLMSGKEPDKDMGSTHLKPAPQAAPWALGRGSRPGPLPHSGWRKPPSPQGCTIPKAWLSVSRKKEDCTLFR